MYAGQPNAFHDDVDVEEARLLPHEDRAPEDGWRGADISFLTQLDGAPHNFAANFWMVARERMQELSNFLKSSPKILHLALLATYTALFFLAYLQMIDSNAPE